MYIQPFTLVHWIAEPLSPRSRYGTALTLVMDDSTET